ncbi:metallophosphoesterase [Candidatus Uabimicrobium sp. HlEnr_7]|uniref:metallophosphoesterase family protein n=1 Tax=Candidatus Uabimicrobium helgolandensis TaxID=3095367 RepID=UPI003558AFDC
MRYGLLGDIHSNLEALEAVIDFLENQNIDKYLCVGDIVNFGANPKECVKLIRELSSIVVAGNHDYAVVGKLQMAYW